MPELHEKIRRAHKTGDVASLLEGLRDERLAPLAAQRLGELQASEAIPDLMEVLESSDPQARAAAAKSLGQIAAPAAWARLSQIATNDPVPWVRSWALFAVGQAGGPDVSVYAERALLDTDWRVRLMAAEICGETGNRDVLPALLEAMRHDRWYRRRRYSKAIRQLLRTIPDGK